jgi:hypothetical protein
MPAPGIKTLPEIIVLISWDSCESQMQREYADPGREFRLAVQTFSLIRGVTSVSFAHKQRLIRDYSTKCALGLSCGV